MGSVPKILLIEDDDELAALLIEYLAPHGFELEREADGESGAQRILSWQPELVILDLMLPRMNGLDVCRTVRSEYAGAILMLTASQSEADHVLGLELGADDFVIKPIEPRVLLARIRSRLRRVAALGSEPQNSDSRLRIGELLVEARAREIFVGETAVELTTMEFDVLLMLAQNTGEVVQRDDLYTRVLGIEYDGLDRGMDVHISRIRRKLGRAGFDGSRLKSVRGVGYLLASP